MPTRVVFMGSPEFSLPALRSLAGTYPIAGVVTQPDRPAGRGQALTPPPVKELAVELNLPVIQPRRLREAEAMDQLLRWSPDLIVVAAFGQILRQEILDLPRFGCINVHASLLPRWRGAGPIQAAILAGDERTGVTIMRMNAGVDTGDILSQRQIPIDEQDTAETLSAKLAQLGADLLLKTLPGYLNGELQPQPQDEASAAYAPLLKKDDGRLDFSLPAEALARKVRAYHPWPGAFTTWQGQPLKVLQAHAVAETAARPGETLVFQGNPAVGSQPGSLVLDRVQPAGKRAMDGKVFLTGARGWGQAPLS